MTKFKQLGMAIFAVLACAALVGCATTGRSTSAWEHGPNNMLAGKDKMQKTDNFLVIFDASSTMTFQHAGKKKLDIAKGFVSHMNQTIPGLKLKSGLRTFGNTWQPFYRKTKLVYGMTDYTKAGLHGALVPIWAGGRSPLDLAFEGGTVDIENLKGNIAVIVVTDAIVSDNSAVTAAAAMKRAYGDRVCIYPVLIGDDSGGKAVMQKIADVGKCGFAASAADLTADDKMAAYVEKVFLGRLDSDGDGVYDDKDECPGTPKGAKVNSVGCWIIKGLNFDTAKHDVKPVYHAILDEVVTVLKKNPDMSIEIQGHTDKRGGEVYNQGLSERRANAVLEYFVSKGIEKERLKAKGYGLTKPVATNDTPEGMAENRRVQLKPLM